MAGDSRQTCPPTAVSPSPWVSSTSLPKMLSTAALATDGESRLLAIDGVAFDGCRFSCSLAAWNSDRERKDAPRPARTRPNAHRSASDSPGPRQRPEHPPRRKCDGRAHESAHQRLRVQLAGPATPFGNPCLETPTGTSPAWLACRTRLRGLRRWPPRSPSNRADEPLQVEPFSQRFDQNLATGSREKRSFRLALSPCGRASWLHAMAPSSKQSATDRHDGRRRAFLHPRIPESRRWTIRRFSAHRSVAPPLQPRTISA
jgi:hypothetical protein